MRVVLDTSVVIAAVITSRGVSAGILTCVLESHELILSDFILDEVARKLRGKFRFDEIRLTRVISALRSIAQMVDPTPLSAVECRDAEDLPILGTALAGGASFLISVDKDLLSLGKFRGIAIVKPGEFWKHSRSV